MLVDIAEIVERIGVFRVNTNGWFEVRDRAAILTPTGVTDIAIVKGNRQIRTAEATGLNDLSTTRNSLIVRRSRTMAQRGLLLGLALRGAG